MYIKKTNVANTRMSHWAWLPRSQAGGVEVFKRLITCYIRINLRTEINEIRDYFRLWIL